jgi:hypothetical protein
VDWILGGLGELSATQRAPRAAPSPLRGTFACMSNGSSGVRARLLEALGTQALVEVHRSIPDADIVEGCVIAIGEQWLLLSGFNWDGVTLDRFIALRVDDVETLEPLDHGAFKLKALQLQGLWPPPVPALPVDLDTTRTLITSFAAQSPLVNIELEHDDPEAASIGTLVAITDEEVTMLEITPDAEWDDEPTSCPLGEITWVEFGGPYLAALAAVAGRPPR